MIGHDNELMQNVLLLLVIVGEDIKHQLGDAFVSETMAFVATPRW
jgi:hypothetical protein